MNQNEADKHHEAGVMAAALFLEGVVFRVNSGNYSVQTEYAGVIVSASSRWAALSGCVSCV